jgi:hypothetical protein
MRNQQSAVGMSDQVLKEGSQSKNQISGKKSFNLPAEVASLEVRRLAGIQRHQFSPISKICAAAVWRRFAGKCPVNEEAKMS